MRNEIGGIYLASSEDVQNAEVCRGWFYGRLKIGDILVCVHSYKTIITTGMFSPTETEVDCNEYVLVNRVDTKQIQLVCKQKIAILGKFGSWIGKVDLGILRKEGETINVDMDIDRASEDETVKRYHCLLSEISETCNRVVSRISKFKENVNRFELDWWE